MWKKTASIFIIPVIFLLTACQETAPVTEPSATTGEPVTEEPTALENGIQATGETGVSRVEAEVQLSDADISAYNGAIELNDPSFCDKISDQNFKDKCKADLNDMNIVEQAKDEEDETLCENMSTEDKKEACIIQVETIIKAEELKLQKEKETEEKMQLSNDVVDSGDLARCSELGEDYVVSCEIDILLNKALAEKTVSVCDGASTQLAVDTCKDRYDSLAQDLEEE